MADDAAGRERRIAAAVVALAVCAVGGLMIVTAVLAANPTPQLDTGSEAAPAPASVVVAITPAAESVEPDTAHRGEQVASSWVDEESRRTGIGVVALDAYGRAALALAEEQPGCHVGWTTLAGIGGIESGHGTNGGARVLPDGTTSHPILGPALDGRAGTAAIRSDDQSVRWHGDARWDHAVGPMQFIPSTWRRWGADGDGDGDANPNDIRDAALAAGRYLCAAGSDLGTGEGWTRAIFSYNHSDDYVLSVLARANHYAG